MDQWINLYRASLIGGARPERGPGGRGASGAAQRGGAQWCAGELPVDLLQVTLMVCGAGSTGGRIIERHQQRQGNGWLCGQCGEENGANFDICWRCHHDPHEHRSLRISTQGEVDVISRAGHRDRWRDPALSLRAMSTETRMSPETLTVVRAMSRIRSMPAMRATLPAAVPPRSGSGSAASARCRVCRAVPMLARWRC